LHGPHLDRDTAGFLSRMPIVDPAWLDVVDRNRPPRRLALTGNRVRIGSAAHAELRVDGAVATPRRRLVPTALRVVGSGCGGTTRWR
jgi:hypothetical protein